MDVAQCCYNLTTKKLWVELQPLRVGHGATASDAPAGGGLPISLLCQEVAGAQRPSPTYLNNLMAWPGLKEEESRPCRVEKRIGGVAYRLKRSAR